MKKDKNCPVYDRPAWWQGLRYVSSPTRYLEEAQASCGDVFVSHFLGTPPCVLVADPDALQDIYGLGYEDADVGIGNLILRPLLGNNSLLAMDGARHRHHRKLLMPPFHGAAILEYGDLVREITNRAIAENSRFSAIEFMQDIVLEAIFRIFFGVVNAEIKASVNELLGLTENPLLIMAFEQDRLKQNWWPTWQKFLRLKARFRAFVCDCINNPTPGSLLALLLETVDEEGNSLDSDDICDEALTILVGGNETTAVGLTWALFWIYKIPEVKEKLRAALDEADDLLTCEYLQAVCYETLRLNSHIVLANARLLKRQTKIGNYQFGPGTWLKPCPYLLHRREDLYPEPRAFKPERFLDRKFSPTEYSPFGGGNRYCLGRVFALSQMKWTLASIVKADRLKLLTSTPPKDKRRTIGIAPKDEIVFATLA